jgi:hypothetical protein
MSNKTSASEMKRAFAAQQHSQARKPFLVLAVIEIDLNDPTNWM